MSIYHFLRQSFELTTLAIQLRPEADLDVELGPPITRGSWKDGQVVKTTTTSLHQATAATPNVANTTSSKIAFAPPLQAPSTSGEDAHMSDGSAESDDVLGSLTAAPPWTSASMQPSISNTQSTAVAKSSVLWPSECFTGESSTIALLKNARKVKKTRVRELPTSYPPSNAERGLGDNKTSTTFSSTSYREQYWSTPQVRC
jgi:hypothetical protein